MPIPTIHILLVLSLHHLQAYPSGLWTLFLLAKPMSQEPISHSGNLQWKNSGSFFVSISTDNQFSFLIITFKLSLTKFCYAHQGTPHICPQLHYERGWANRKSMIPLPLASVGSDKGWQSLPPVTLVLLTGAHWLDGHSNNQSQ